MNITTYIARRFLITGRRNTLLSVLTALSIGGVTVGTAVLIVVMSVFNGFFVLVRDMMLSYDPDIRIEAASTVTFTASDSLLTAIRSRPDFKTATPFVEGKALLAHRGYQSKVVLVRGIDPVSFYPLLGNPSPVTLGAADLSIVDGVAGLLLGETLMDQLRVSVGERIGLLSAASVTKMLTQPGFSTGTPFDLRGGFQLKPVIDGSLAFTSLPAAQRIFRVPGQWTGIDIKVHRFDDTFSIADSLRRELGSGFRIRTWYDLHKSIYDVMFLEKWVAYAVLLIIVLVAVLNILASLTMIVIQKTRDIGVLRTLGLTQEQIRRIFINQGFVIGLVGSGVGGVLGTLAAWLQQEFGLVRLAGSESFIIDAYPVSIQGLDIAFVVLGTLILCVAASAYPAWRASSIEPADAIRYE